MTKPITAFLGEYRFLSNFYPATIVLDGETYSSVEHAYQASKTNDPVGKSSIRMASTPGKAKNLGKRVTLVANWEEIKIPTMSGLLWQKFQDPVLKQKLLDTGDAELIEGNWWGDVFWGQHEGEGLNWLGKLLMMHRDNLRG